MSVDRRSFLGLFAAGLLAGATSWTHAANASAGPGRVRSVEESEEGTTLTLDLTHAPFPHGGAAYRDRTVLVFVPRTFAPERGGRVPMLVHFHGHHTTADKAIVSHQLREQLVESRQNAVLVVPQGPVNAADSSAGKLEAPGAFARLLEEVLRTLTSSEARLSLGRRALQAGTVCISAHSGGFHAAACCARPDRAATARIDVNEIYLFDALYADLAPFRDWVIEGRGRPARRRHKLVSYYGPGATESNSQWLLAELKKKDVRCAYETVEGTLSREELVKSDAVFVRTQVGHNGVTHELNALRDCLYASGLPRHLSTAWFEAKTGARPIDRRRRR